MDLDNSQTIPLSILLREELAERKRKNASYSLRAFARSLHLSPSYLSKLMNGKRVASEETLLKAAQLLKISDEKLNQIAERGRSGSGQHEFQRLQLDQFSLIADWHHYAILEAVTLGDFQGTAKWFAKRLSISEERAQTALDRLVRIGLLTLDKGGKIIPKVQDHSSVVENLASAHTEHERQVLEGALRALSDCAPEYRHQGSVTLAIPSSRLPEAREKIRQFRRELMGSLQRRGRRDAIYQLSISFFPVTDPKNHQPLSTGAKT